MESKSKKKKKNKKKFLLIIPIIFLFLFGVAAGAYFYVNGKIQMDTDNTKIFTNPEDAKEAQLDEEKGLINILLVGVDARPGEKIGRTDSIILATLDTNNKRVKLTSFMRDMYVEIPGHKNNKINAAYALGGPELLIKTINHNFNLSIQYFASINFNGFQEVVDKLGGVNVEVKDYEVKEINKFIYEVNGSKATLLAGPGYQTLNGQQALSYSRIRHVGNNDYERTERQRRVLSVLMDKAKKTSVLKLPDLVATMLPYIKTNIPTPKLLSIANTVYKFGSTPTDTLRLPGDRMFQSMNIPGSGDSLVPDLEKNVALLDQFIYSTGGATAGNMPAYMANNFHANDISLDRRGKKKPVVKIEVPKPDPNQPETPQEGEDLTAPTAPVITQVKKDNVVTVTIGGSQDNVGVTGYEYSFDNKAWEPYTVPIEVNEDRIIYARAKDAADNLSLVTRKEIKLQAEPTVDNEPPTLPKVTQKVEDKFVKFTIEGSTDKSGVVIYSYSFDNNSWKDTNGTVTVSIDEISKYEYIYVIAVDKYNNRTDVVKLKIDQQVSLTH